MEERLPQLEITWKNFPAPCFFHGEILKFGNDQETGRVKVSMDLRKE